MRALFRHFTINSDDEELVHAQFRSCCRHMPLLYGILLCNSFGIGFLTFDPQQVAKTLLTPALIGATAIWRAVWWMRQQDTDELPTAVFCRYLKRTCFLAAVLTAAFVFWVIWLYQDADDYTRVNLLFFMSLTVISSVFCLMSLRAAAMRVAAISSTAFIFYFSWVDGARLLSQTLVLCCVCAGMVVVTLSFNHSFNELIRSQRSLRDRQRETERLSEENRRIAFTDALSGLPNRRELLSQLDRLEEAGDLPRDTLAVIFVDLDGFKDVNDEHGHQAGDALIRDLCQRLQRHCPDYAMLARVGGDEFAILIKRPSGAASAQSLAFTLAQRFLKEIALPVLFDQHVLQVSGSIGIAANVDSCATPRELLRRADLAMYHAKTEGKAQIAYYSEELDIGRLHRLCVQEQIGIGLTRDEFDLAYQPIVDADTGRILSVEALLRWPRRPEGELLPEDFIRIAEMTGQIHQLGLFALERACRDLGPFAPLCLSVNVSPAQFRHPAFEQQVLQILEQTGFPYQRLQLEITEGYLLTNPERAISAIGKFKEKGIAIALDDFGTGFTSIQYLRSYGFTHIKIDKSLLTGLGRRNKSEMLVTGAVILACALDMRVVAEGVESEDQATILRSVGCHEMQGYLFGRPMSLHELLIFLGTQWRSEAYRKA